MAQPRHMYGSDPYMWLCQILCVKFYSFTVLVLVLMVVNLVLALEIYFRSCSRSRHILVSLTSLMDHKSENKIKV